MPPLATFPCCRRHCLAGSVLQCLPPTASLTPYISPPQVSLVQDEEPSDLHKAGSPVEGVFALGDCCADLDHPLPALAQVRLGRAGPRRLT